MQLYRAYEAAVRGCGPIRIHPTKTRIGFITRMTFAGASLKKRYIDITLMLPYRSKSRRFRKIETFGPGTHVHHLRISSLEEIDDKVRGWLREAYSVGQQESRA